MKFDKPNCPKCGEKAKGTLEKLQACAELDWDVEEATYSGSTDVHWNSQETVFIKGDKDPDCRTVILYCECGEDWASDVKDFG
jgi:hypothetical protein